MDNRAKAFPVVKFYNSGYYIKLHRGNFFFKKLNPATMQPNLLPANEATLRLTDHTRGTICRNYALGEDKYYFTLHPERQEEQAEYSATGRYLAVLLTPRGLRAFFLVKDVKGKYVIDEDGEDENGHPLMINTKGHKQLRKTDEFVSIYIEAVANEIKQRFIFIKHYLGMMAQAIAEFNMAESTVAATNK